MKEAVVRPILSRADNQPRLSAGAGSCCEHCGCPPAAVPKVVPALLQPLSHQAYAAAWTLQPPMDAQGLSRGDR